MEDKNDLRLIIAVVVTSTTKSSLVTLAALLDLLNDGV
jgi:hypothetical protein